MLSAAWMRAVRVVQSPMFERFASAVVALGTGTVLGLSAWLEPAAAGHSTHLQLGLQPCTFYSLTGQPCPLCGATTTFALLAEGRVIEGLINQPFAAVLFVLTVIVFAICVAEAALPRGRWSRLLAKLAPYEGRIAAGVLVLMGAGWVYKIVMLSGQAAS